MKRNKLEYQIVKATPIYYDDSCKLAHTIEIEYQIVGYPDRTSKVKVSPSILTDTERLRRKISEHYRIRSLVEKMLLEDINGTEIAKNIEGSIL